MWKTSTLLYPVLLKCLPLFFLCPSFVFVSTFVFTDIYPTTTKKQVPDFRSAGGMYETLQPELLTASEFEREGMEIDPTMVYEKDFFLENQLPCLGLQRPFIFGVQNRKWKVGISYSWPYSEFVWHVMTLA